MKSAEKIRSLKRDKVTKRRTVLIISQVFAPDSPSVGQYVYDLARELVRRDHRVVVFTPRRGYEDPTVRFPYRETMDGIEVKRLPWCAFGKRTILMRLLGGGSLVLQSMLRGLFVKGISHVLISSSPPWAGLAASFIQFFHRRIRIIYWVMDLISDEMIILGKVRKESWVAKISEWGQRHSLRSADSVVTLDRYMAERLQRKTNLDGKLTVIPPWPYDEQLVEIPHEQNLFRKEHHYDHRFVVMYSGNITDVHPLTTLWQAISKLKADARFVFVFIGAKAAREKIEVFAAENGLANVDTLGYVPLSETKYSLSAADLHVVTMGNEMAGVVHPCKVYGIMGVGRPLLAISPKESHIGAILKASSAGWLVEHGNVDRVVQVLQEAQAMSSEDRLAMGARGRDLVQHEFSRRVLCGRFIEVLK